MSFFRLLSGVLRLLEEQVRNPFTGEAIEDGRMDRSAGMSKESRPLCRARLTHVLSV